MDQGNGARSFRLSLTSYLLALPTLSPAFIRIAGFLLQRVLHCVELSKIHKAITFLSSNSSMLFFYQISRAYEV